MNFIENNGLFLGHHRLPIQTELGDSWEQPLVLKNNKGFLLFNGEIFNYDKNSYKSDTEYLFDVFSNCDKFDPRIMNNWDGFWSIVYINKNDVWCFTDPLGKKQLYYNKQGEICSEIAPLRNKSDLDLLFKSNVFKWGYNINDLTPFADVKRVLPGKIYHFKKNYIKDNPYEYFDWNSTFNKNDLERLLFDSVKNRLVSKNYKIGCLISGGLDSSIIAYILNELKAEVDYYSIENGEEFYVNLLIKDLGIKLNYLNYNLDEDLINSFIYNETPIDLGSVLPQHKLFSVIKNKIVISGDGADELFGGYKRINDYDSQRSDIFEELSFYHLPRLDRASMRYTIELRNPFLSHDIVRLALNLPLSYRKNKSILKDLFRGKINDQILDRVKAPLKNPEIVLDPMVYRKKIHDSFYKNIKNYD